MRLMFKGAYLFDQNLASWDLSSITEVSEPGTNNSRFQLIDMLDSCGMSIQNYEATLLGWASNPTTPDSLDLGSAALQYCDDTGRDILLSKGWRISGDSKADDIDCSPSSTHSLDELNLSVFPNPTNSTITFTVDNSFENNVYYHVVSQDGQVFTKGKLIGNQTKLDFLPGLYFLKVNDNHRVGFKKIVVVK